MVTREEMEHVLTNVRMEAKAEAEFAFEARLEAQPVKMKDEMMLMVNPQSETSRVTQVDSLALIHQSTKESCNVIHGPASKDCEITTGEPRDLFVEDPLRRLVAHRSVHNLGLTVHHQQLKEDQVRVSVEEVIIADALVPIPTRLLKIVSDVKNTFISWQKNLVSIRPKETLITPVDSSRQVSELKLNVIQEVILIPYDKKPFKELLLPLESIVGKSEGPSLAIVDKVDLISLVAPQQKLTVRIVLIFLMYMHHMLLSKGKTNKYGFICPTEIAGIRTISALKSKYLSNRLCGTPTECFLAPYVNV